MQRIPTSVMAAVGLIGGFAVTKLAHHRRPGGLVAGSIGLLAVETSRRRAGTAAALAVGGSYVTALAVSHPLAKKLGAWPSVFTVAAAAATTAHLVADRARVDRS